MGLGADSGGRTQSTRALVGQREASDSPHPTE